MSVSTFNESITSKEQYHPLNFYLVGGDEIHHLETVMNELPYICNSTGVWINRNVNTFALATVPLAGRDNLDATLICLHKLQKHPFPGFSSSVDVVGTGDCDYYTARLSISAMHDDAPFDDLIKWIEQTITEFSNLRKDEYIALWSEGYVATGQRSEAIFHGRYKAQTLHEAVIQFMETLSDNDKRYIDLTSNPPRFWACRFFDNEIDARKSFG